MNKKEAVLQKLSTIIDPDLTQDIVRLGFVKHLVVKGDSVSLTIELTTPACPVKDHFKQQAITQVKQLPWVNDVTVTMTAQTPTMRPKKDGLQQVDTIVAVASCKGGVGKSTVAINMAFQLAKTGAKVGFFDADIYGPSLDTLIHLPPEALGIKDNFIHPKVFQDVKLMSFAYTQDPREPEPAVMRGPMVTRVIQQLLLDTQWGALDYLVIDMPPGTGDIHITLGQAIPITGALIVTTPHPLSLVDVMKGIAMFDSLKIPTIGVVENMSYFTCDGCDKQHYPYGQGARAYLEDHYGFQDTVEFPLDPAMAQACANGVPLVVAQPDHALTQTFTQLTNHMVQALAKQKHQPELPLVVYDSKHTRINLTHNEDTHYIVPLTLRKACRCALCLEASDTVSIDPSVYPIDIQPVGRYAIGIQWSDNHASLYPYNRIVSFVTEPVL